MNNVENCESGQELILSRKTFDGEFENVPVEFVRAHASDPGRCWVKIAGKDFRVAIKKLSLAGEEVAAHVKYGQAEAPEAGNASTGEIDKPEKKSKVVKLKSEHKADIPKVEIIKKEEPVKEAPKKVVDATKETSELKKLERVVRYCAANKDASRKEVAEAVNGNINYCGIIRSIVNLYANNMSPSDILTKYAWLKESKLNQIISIFESCQPKK